MSTSREAARQEAVAFQSRRNRWRRQQLTNRDEIHALLDKVAAAMARKGYAASDTFAVRLALEETLVNAIRHGNRENPGCQVRVRCQTTSKRVLLEVRDEGMGFDPHKVPDPFAPENLERPSGRGLLLMRAYMTWVHFSRRGNCVRLCKERTEAHSGPSAGC
jgi:serine/threonine-protein kinase RsbW